MICRACGIKGHIEKVCQTKNQNTANRNAALTTDNPETCNTRMGIFASTPLKGLTPSRRTSYASWRRLA